MCFFVPGGESETIDISFRNDPKLVTGEMNNYCYFSFTYSKHVIITIDNAACVFFFVRTGESRGNDKIHVWSFIQSVLTLL